MKLAFINRTTHALLDYTAAAALIVLPFILDLGATSSLALWLSVGGGLGLIGYSLLTTYDPRRSKLLSFKIHLGLDLGAAAVFLAAPFAFGWHGVTAIYYWVMGAGVLVVVACSARSEPMPRVRVETIVSP